MTTPKGKILLAKLPKDIVQFCIEPFLMISKEEVRKNYQNLMNQFHSYSPINWRRLEGVWNAQNQMNDYVLMPHNYVVGNDRWPDIFFAEMRYQRYKKRKWAAKEREVRRVVIAACIIVFLFITFMVSMGVYVSSRSK